MAEGAGPGGPPPVRAPAVGRGAAWDPAARPGPTAGRLADPEDLTRGVARLFWLRGIAVLAEVPLPDGHRADLVGIARDGSLWCVEIKVSAEDLRRDVKSQAYRAWCDRFCWAVPAALAPWLDHPAYCPAETGLVVADRHEAVMLREPAAPALSPARRRALTLRLARLGAARLARAADPGFERDCAV